MKTMLLIVVIALLLLTGCPGNAVKRAEPVVVKVPEVITVTQVVKEYVSLPKELLVDCANDKPKEQTGLEAKRLSILRDLSIIECNKRLSRARELNGKVK